MVFGGTTQTNTVKLDIPSQNNVLNEIERPQGMFPVSPCLAQSTNKYIIAEYEYAEQVALTITIVDAVISISLGV